MDGEEDALTMSIFKNYKIVLWLFFVVLALLLIAPNPNPEGYVITFTGKDAPDGLQKGDMLLSINGVEFTENLLSQQYEGITKIETERGVQFFRLNGTLDVAVEKASSSNLHFGLDLKGGVRALISMNQSDPETAKQVKDTLQRRIGFFGLREAVFRTITAGNTTLIEISMAGGSPQELEDLLETQGTFEAKINFLTRELNLKTEHGIIISNNTFLVDGKNVNVGESFTLDGITFRLNEISLNRINITADVFTGDDIKTVFFDPQRSRIDNVGSGYQWSFAVQISADGAERFAQVTKNMQLGSAGSLAGSIELYLDGDLLDTLSISSNLRGQAATEVSISGGADTMEEAIAERSRLQAILRSGALPTSIEIVGLDNISPSLGSDFLKNALLAAVGAIIGIIIVVGIRYRRPRFIVPMIIISLSEVLITIGIATGIGWTIDLAAIAAIIATVGTGVNSQIIIIDQTLRGVSRHEESTKEKLKRAFFIIFGSAGTMIVAMLPLTFSGLSLLQGFAIVTIIGVLTGAIITRPAFGAIVERLVR